MSETETAKHVARRTVLKGAAWSVPVVAAAAATPLAAASVNQNLDVGVYGYCSGQYDITKLQAVLASVSLVGLPIGIVASQLVDIVKAALAAVGINDGAKRGFTITVKGATLPQGATFDLTTTPGTLLALNLQLPLVNLINAQATFLANVNGTGVTLTTQSAIPAGGGADVQLTEGLLDVDALTTTHLTFNPATDKTTTPEDPDTGSFTTLVGTPVNLGALNLLPAITAILGSNFLNGALATALGLLLTGKTLRIQLCQ